MKIIVIRSLLILGGLLLGILGEWQPWFDHDNAAGPGAGSMPHQGHHHSRSASDG